MRSPWRRRGAAARAGRARWRRSSASPLRRRLSKRSGGWTRRARATCSATTRANCPCSSSSRARRRWALSRGCPSSRSGRRASRRRSPTWTMGSCLSARTLGIPSWCGCGAKRRTMRTLRWWSTFKTWGRSSTFASSTWSARARGRSSPARAPLRTAPCASSATALALQSRRRRTCRASRPCFRSAAPRRPSTTRSCSCRLRGRRGCSSSSTGRRWPRRRRRALKQTRRRCTRGNLSADLVVQACPSVVALLDAAAGFKRADSWAPPAGARVVAASSAGRQVLVAVTGGRLVSLLVDVEAKKLTVAASVTLPNEVSCVDCSLLTGSAGASSSRADDAMTDVDVTPATAARESPTLAAVGMWTEVSVRLLSLPGLQPLRTELLGGQVISRSVLLATLEEVDYLLVALGDGHLFTFHVDASVVPGSALMDDGMQSEVQPQLSAAAKEALLSDRKRVTVGSQPASLSAFTTRGATHVFAACDRPTVVHASAGGSKLLCSHVNLRAVTRVVGFHSAAFPDCLAVATPTSLLLGAVDDIQKLHIRTVPLGEGPRRITHAPAAHMFGVLTTALAVDEAGDETEDHYLRLLDDTTFETRDSFKLDMNEMGCSLFSTKLPPSSSPMEPSEQGLDMAVGDGDGGGAGLAGEECFVLGTAYTLPDEDEPSKGRILVLTMEGGQLRLRAELPVRGAVYCIHHIHGMLVAGVNHTVILLAWAVRGGVSGTNQALVLRDTCVGSTVALLLATRGDFVIVGDMIKSVSVLRFSSGSDGSKRLEEVARDYGCHWMTAVAALDDEVYMGGENGFNLITLRRRSGAVNEEERAQLDLVGTFHTGDFINRLLPGSLVMREDRPAGAGADATSAAALAAQTLLYGAVSGAVGVMVRLCPEDFALLRRVEVALNVVVKGIGGFRHGEWRAFATEAAGPSSGFGTTALGAGGPPPLRGGTLTGTSLSGTSIWTATRRRSLPRPSTCRWRT
eukprot:TRINITY_DN3064_c0_g1_i3.p1 TRINITY_DN3064_c0_g1~~TRINITY_DN3064_c0_g1_i3.p1  ORF type:complete len:969 (-),score=249.57 TRINITY_DN3064_c0_g1_i3:635-3541(-)